MYLLLFLILIFYWFIIRPYLKVRKVMKDAQRQANEFFGGTGSPFGGRRTGQAHSQTSNPRRHRKKIDPDVGEYIEFEEISTVTTYTYTERKYDTEEQISDAEWEEIR